MATSGKSASIRNRIRGYREVPASLIDGAPWNWRTHGDEQKAVVRASLEELGIIDALKVREVPGGRFQLFDGHLRSDLFISISPDTIVPILVTDLDEAEAKKANAIFDPSGAMAEADQAKLDELISSIETDTKVLADLMEQLASEEESETQIKALDTQPPPVMTWVLVGIPTVRFGEISADVERIARINGVLCETTANNG